MGAGIKPFPQNGTRFPFLPAFAVEDVPAALTLVWKRRLTALADKGAMFLQLHLQGLSRTALLLSGAAAMFLALLGSTPGAV